MTNLAISDETAVAPQEVFIDGKSITERDLEETCNKIVENLYSSGDITEISTAITNLNGVETLAAKAKSKLIFEWSVWYKDTNPEGNFADWFVQKFGGEKLTVQKHQAIGELLRNNDVPQEVKDKNTKELISVARAVQSGYDLTDAWDKIKIAGSEAEVNDIIREVKGKPKRLGSLDLVVYSDGSIVGFMDNERVNLGWLNYTDRDAESNPAKKRILETGIARVINNSRMKEA